MAGAVIGDLRAQVPAGRSADGRVVDALKGPLAGPRPKGPRAGVGAIVGPVLVGPVVPDVPKIGADASLYPGVGGIALGAGPA